MDHMDWYFDTDGDNLLFLKDQEGLNEHVVPEYCSQFGLSMSDNLGLSKKCSTGEEHKLHGQSLYYEAHKGNSLPKRENSINSNKFTGFPKVDYGGENQESSLHRNWVLDNHSDYRQIDDLLTDMIMNSWTISGDQSVTSISKNSGALGSPLTIWDKVEDTSAFIIPSDSGQMQGCSMAMAAREQNSWCSANDEENSLEESILHELEVVMKQLTQNIRICFRDALYRLANSSEKRHLSRSQTGRITMDTPSLSPVGNETLRFERMKSMEVETNAIDRTIASLMFYKLN